MVMSPVYTSTMPFFKGTYTEKTLYTRRAQLTHAQTMTPFDGSGKEAF